MITLDDPRHGTNPGYIAGCREDCCRTAHRDEGRDRRRHPSPLTPAIGVHRRIQALHRLGWSGTALSKHAGHTQFWVQQILKQDRVTQATAAKIVALYDELSMTWCTDTWASRTAAAARARGWAPPLAWDDEDLDNPDATPYASQEPIDIDDVVVDRVLAGEWHLPTTKAERAEVCRRWYATGRSLTDLSRLTGWKPERYFRACDEVAA
ncbi:hypothetical protein [Nocardioides sp.]|uniref:hypothetical protein n=1 Tax=Nocardioides sp. TaxID=35761 RepID=UPI003567FEF3